MITFTGKDYRPGSLSVAVNDGYSKSDKRCVELTAKANPELETGSVVQITLSELDATMLYEYLRRALEGAY